MQHSGSTKYLALLVGAATSDEKANISSEDSSKFLEAWQAWTTKYADSIENHGSPLGSTAIVTSDSAQDSSNSYVAWMVVSADSVDDAAAMLQEHPHLSLLPGNRVELIEQLAPPSGPLASG